MNNELLNFVQEIINSKPEFSELDPETKEELTKDLLESAENRVKSIILTNTQEDKLEELEILMNENNEEKLQEFYKQNIPNLSALIASELIALRSMYIA